MNKRNEEYLEGERIVLSPFFNRQGDGFYTLSKEYLSPVQPQVLPSCVSKISEWAVEGGDAVSGNGYFLRERRSFDERDYNEYG